MDVPLVIYQVEGSNVGSVWTKIMERKGGWVLVNKRTQFGAEDVLDYKMAVEVKGTLEDAHLAIGVIVFKET